MSAIWSEQRTRDKQVGPQLFEEQKRRCEHDDKDQVIRSPEQPPACTQRSEIRRQLFARIEVHQSSGAKRHSRGKRQQRKRQAAEQKRYRPAQVERWKFASLHCSQDQHDQCENQNPNAQVVVALVLAGSRSGQPREQNRCPAARIEGRQKIQGEDSIATRGVATSSFDDQTQ